MSSTYVSKFIIPGRRAGNIKQIINDVGYTKFTQTIVSNPVQPFIITSGNPTIDYSNNYYTITFLDNGGITFLLPLTNADNDFNALVVGGGGGGNTSNSNFINGGGGGAGGEVVYSSIDVIYQNINYNIVVGQGGAPTNNGSFSKFSTLVAYGGNTGTAASNSVGGNGGVGVNGGGSGGNGGTSVGIINATDGQNGTLVTINSIPTYYGGGGGGGSYDGQPSSAVGGLGGGGGGGFNSNIGTPNTGGGGGGGNGNGNSLRLGGPGGSGIVILYFKYIPVYSFNKPCICPSPINSKIIKNSNPDVIPASTQTARAVNAIKYARGGRVVFGNAAYNSNGNTLLGRLNGGYEPPIKNKF